MCVCVCLCPCQLHNLSCCCCCSAALWPPAVCACKLLKFDFSHVCTSMCVCQLARPACLSVCAWLITELLPTLLRSSTLSLALSLFPALCVSAVPCCLSYMCGICFYSLEHKILWRWKPERMLQQNNKQQAVITSVCVCVFIPNTKYPREITSWIYL